MFQKSPDDRLSEWKLLREKLDHSDSPIDLVIDFWKDAPLIVLNHRIDRYNQNSWPTPWEIIIENKYDEFTMCIMIGYTLLLTKKFANSTIELRTLVDENRTRLYTLLYIDDSVVLNYDRTTSINAHDIPASLMMENSINITRPR